MIEKLEAKDLGKKYAIHVKVNEIIDTINEQQKQISVLTSTLLKVRKMFTERDKKIDFIMENTGKESLYSEVSGATRREYKTLKKLYSE